MFMMIKKNKLQLFLVRTTKIVENPIIWWTIIVRCKSLKCIFAQRIYVICGLVLFVQHVLSYVKCRFCLQSTEHMCRSFWMTIRLQPFFSFSFFFFRVYFCSTSHTIAQMCIASIVWQNFLRIWILHHLYKI